MNPSERIRVALSRSETVRQTVEEPPSNPTLSPKAEVESTLALLAANEQDRATSVPVETSAAHAPARARAATTETRQPAGADVLRRFRRRYLLLAAASLVALCAVLLRDRGSAPPKPEAVISPKLQVEVKSEGNGLLSVHWNPRSTPIAGAREGRLIILEPNQQPRTVELQPDQLNTGYVYYQSSAERLEFRLEVVENSGAVVKESVLALSSGTPQPTSGAAPVETAAESKPAPKPSKSAAPEKADTSKAASQNAPSQNTEAAQAPEQPAQPAPRAFTPPPQSTQSAEARAVELDPAAPIAARTTTAAPRIDFGAAAGMAPPPVRPPAPPARNGARIGGNVEAAVLIKRVTPAYPAMAKSAGVQGTVRFTATVDKTGHVQNLQLVSGHQMLVHAAAEAVKQWVYRPMMLDGKPADVITQIEVRFAIHD